MVTKVTLARTTVDTPSTRAPLVAVAAGALLLAPTLIRPGAHGPVLCPLRRVTGVWCPTCGMTRALGWLAHGDVDAAVRLHPLAPVLVIESVIAVALWGWLRRTRGARADWSPRWVAFGRVVLVANAVLVLTVWVIRLKSGSFDDLG